MKMICLLLLITMGLLLMPIFAAPPRTTDLLVTGTSYGTRAKLQWTAPIPASPYTLVELDIRRSKNPITILNFTSQTRCELFTDPGSPGIIQNATITSLEPNTTNYFALRYRDSSSGTNLNSNTNWSAVSNGPRVITPASTTSFPVSLQWDQCQDKEVTGYKIYFGTATGHYTASVNVGNVTTAQIPGLSYGVTYYFAATSLDAEGNESDFSNEVFWGIY